MNRIDSARKSAANLDIDVAISLYKDAIVYNEYPLVSRLELGKLLINAGAIENGIELLECAAKLFPNKYESLSALGAAYQRVSEQVKAATLLAKAIEINPTAPSWVFYGACQHAADIISLDNPALAYVPMPKCGSTTIKAYILDATQRLKTINPHQFFDNPFFKTSEKKISDYFGYYKFVVLRDPIERFLSYYNHNILVKNSLSESFNKRSVVFGLNTRPEINELISRWDQYCFVFNDFKHHSLPQAAYLGHDLSTFDDVFLLDQIENLLSKLTVILGTEKLPIHLMKSDKPVADLYHELTHDSLQLLSNIYKDDYELIGLPVPF